MAGQQVRVCTVDEGAGPRGDVLLADTQWRHHGQERGERQVNARKALEQVEDRDAFRADLVGETLVCKTDQGGLRLGILCQRSKVEQVLVLFG